MSLRVLGMSIALVSLAGCPSYEAESQIYVQRITAVPVLMTAKVEHSHDGSISTITLSEGGAMGLGCTEYCVDNPDRRVECTQTTVTVNPPGLADVREAFLLSGREGTTVLVAKQPGAGVLVISSPCVSARYRLIIEPF